MSAEPLSRSELRHYIDPRVRRRVRLYIAISIALILVLVYRIAFHGGGMLYPSVAIAIGIVIGILISNMFSIHWNVEANRVISRLDTYGFALLVLYIAFELTSEHFIRQWFSGQEAITVILALAAGAILGRGVGMGRRIMEVLRDNV